MKNTCDSTAIGEPIRRRKRGKWKKLKRGKLQNNTNVFKVKDIIRIILVLLDLYSI